MSKTFVLDVQPSALDPEVTVFRLQGNLNAISLAVFTDATDTAFEAGMTKWVMSVGELEHLSSAGLAAFNTYLNDLRALGGDIYFVGISRKIEKMFRVVGYNRVFRFFEDEDSAIKEFSKARPRH